MVTSTCFQPSVNMNRNKKSLTKFKFSIFSTLSIVLFISSCNGQTSTTKTDKKIHSTKNSQQQPRLVRSFESKFENVSCQILDKDGNIWFSIRGEGAYRYNGKSFDKFTTKDGLCNNEVNAIIQNKKGNIIIGTTNGICQYDGQKFTRYPVPETLNITCLLEDKNENLWFGTMGNGVYRFNGTKLDNFLHSKDPIFNLGTKYQLILDILQDKKGNIWFSSWNGGGVWRYDGKEFKNFLPTAEYYKKNQDKRKLINKQYGFEMSTSTPYDQVQTHITDDMIFSMMEDKDGNIWFATRDHGICYYNGKIFTSIGAKENFNSRGASSILQDDKNNFWITTFDNGVWYYDGKTCKNFMEINGLVNNAVMSALKDKNGNIWFGTKFVGLIRYDGTTFTTISRYEN